MQQKITEQYCWPPANTNTNMYFNFFVPLKDTTTSLFLEKKKAAQWGPRACHCRMGHCWQCNKTQRNPGQNCTEQPGIPGCGKHQLGYHRSSSEQTQNLNETAVHSALWKKQWAGQGTQTPICPGAYTVHLILCYSTLSFFPYCLLLLK